MREKFKLNLFLKQNCRFFSINPSLSKNARFVQILTKTLFDRLCSDISKTTACYLHFRNLLRKFHWFWVAFSLSLFCFVWESQIQSFEINAGYWEPWFLFRKQAKFCLTFVWFFGKLFVQFLCDSLHEKQHKVGTFWMWTVSVLSVFHFCKCLIDLWIFWMFFFFW